MGSEFYLCAASNFSTDLYENNMSSSFTNEVPLNVGKPGEHWAVALDSLSFDKTYSNVPQAICNNSKETQMLLCADNLDSPPFVGSIMLHLNMDLVCYRTVEEVQTELMKKIPNELQTRLNVTVEQGLLNLHLNECYLYISRDMCHWLQINTDGRPEMRNSGSRYPYIEFDYRFADEQAVVVCENNNYATNIPKFIKVSMAEINPSLSGVGLNRNIAVIPFSPQNNKDFFYEPAIKEYYPLVLSNLTRISLEIYDEGEGLAPRVLNLQNGRPTLVKLKFKKMTPSSSFVLHVTSEDSRSLYPANNPSEFRVQMPSAVPLPGDSYEVALMTLHYPKMINVNSCFKNKKNYWFQFVVPRPAIEGGTMYRKKYFDGEPIRSIEDVMNHMNRQGEVVLGSRIFTISSAERTKHTIIRSKKEMQFQMSPMLAYVLMGAHVGRGEKAMEWFFDPSTTANTSFHASDIARSFPQMMFVHADIVSPTIMGGCHSRILKFIYNLDKNCGEHTHATYNSHHLDFVDAASGNLRSMHIQLRDSDGELIKFEDGGTTRATLLYRMKHVF